MAQDFEPLGRSRSDLTAIRNEVLHVFDDSIKKVFQNIAENNDTFVAPYNRSETEQIVRKAHRDLDYFFNHLDLYTDENPPTYVHIDVETIDDLSIESFTSLEDVWLYIKSQRNEREREL